MFGQLAKSVSSERKNVLTFFLKPENFVGLAKHCCAVSVQDEL